MMKKIMILIGSLLSINSFAQKGPDAIVGKWMNVPKQNTIIEVYKSLGKYEGKISWTKEPNDKKPVGYVILRKLEYNPIKKIWENGEIKEPGSGVVYDARVKIKSDGLLEVHGYMGFKFLGKKKSFRRVK